MPNREPDPKVEKFLQNLSALDAGGKARLKRDAGKPLAEAQSLGLFYRLLPYGLSAAQEEIFFFLATLYALADGGGEGRFWAAVTRFPRSRSQEKQGFGSPRRDSARFGRDTIVFPFAPGGAVFEIKASRRELATVA